MSLECVISSQLRWWEIYWYLHLVILRYLYVSRKTMRPRPANVKVQKTFTPSIFREVALYHGKIFLTQLENFNPHNQNMYLLNSNFPELWAAQRLCVTVDFYAVIEPITSSNVNVIVFIFVVTIIRISGHDISVIKNYITYIKM